MTSYAASLSKIWIWANEFTWQWVWDLGVAAWASRRMRGGGGCLAHSKKISEFSAPKLAYLEFFFSKLVVSAEISGEANLMLDY